MADLRIQELPTYAVKKAKKYGADDVIVHSILDKTGQVKFVNNEIVTIKNFENISADIFLVKDKKIVATNIKKFTTSEIDKTLSRIFKFIKYIPPTEDYNGIAKDHFHYKKIPNVYDRQIETLGSHSIDLVENAINSALRNGARRCTGVLDFGVTHVYLSTSTGVHAQDQETDACLSIRSFTSKDASGHKISCGTRLIDVKPAFAGAESGRIAQMAINPKKTGAGKYDVIFDPLALGDLLGGVAGATSIYSVESGMSFFKDKLKQKVASSKFSMRDSGRSPGDLASASFDEEGVPTKDTKVIEDGILKTYLHNTSTARKYKTKTTANAGLISPTPWNTIIKPGDAKYQNLIKRVQKGLLVTNTWYTTFQNYVKGDFSTIPRDAVFLIKNGRIAYPVKDIRISENILNLLESISAVGKKAEQVYSWAAEPPNVGNPVISPPILCKNLNITKSLK